MADDDTLTQVKSFFMMAALFTAQIAPYQKTKKAQVAYDRFAAECLREYQTVTAEQAWEIMQKQEQC